MKLDVRAPWAARMLCLALAGAGLLWGALMWMNPRGVESRVFFERGERLFDDFVAVRTCAEYGYANDRQKLKDACYPALGPAMARLFPLTSSGAAWFTGVGISLWVVSFLAFLGRKSDAESGANGRGATWWMKVAVVVGCLFSSIMLHEFEWGNQIVYAAAGVTLFLAWFDSRSRVLQFGAAVSLAVAGVLKIAPAVLGLLYGWWWMREQGEGRRDCLRAAFVFVVAGIALFTVPFLWYGGWEGFCQWLANASANAREYAHKGAWGFVPIGRTARVVMNMDVSQPWRLMWVERGLSMALGGVCGALAVRCMVKRLASAGDLFLLLVAAMLLVPGNMHFYTGLYLLPVMALRLRENMGWFEAGCWFAMLCPLQIPLGAGCLNHPIANLAFLGLLGMAFRRILRALCPVAGGYGIMRVMKNATKKLFVLSILGAVWAADAMDPWIGELPVKFASGAAVPSLETAVPKAQLVEGDWTRFARVWERLDRGEPIRIAVIGGSITQGAGASSRERQWGAMFAAGWRRAFPRCAIDFVNAGIGATGSEIGAFRLRRDVLEKRPDVVVVEFAVNDSPGRERAESYEGVIRQLLKDPRGIAVIQLGMVSQGGGSAQEWQARVARHYGVPYVSYRDALYYPYVKEGTVKWSDISPDTVHPNDVGHAYAAALLNGTLRARYGAYKASGRAPGAIPALPQPLYGTRYDKGRFCLMQDAKIVENRGFFPLRDNCWGVGLACTNAHGRLVFEVEGPSVAILYRLGNKPHNWGKIAVKIDGAEVVRGLDCFRDQWWWYTPSLFLCRDRPGRHVVEVETLPEKNEKSSAFGCHLTGILVSEEVGR